MCPPPTRCGQERPAAVHDTPEVDAHHPLPRAQRPEPRVGARRDAGVVAHDVHGAEALERGRGQRLHVGLLADVGRHGQHVDAVGLDLRLGGRQRVLLDVGEHDVQAGASPSRLASASPMPLPPPVTTAT